MKRLFLSVAAMLAVVVLVCLFATRANATVKKHHRSDNVPQATWWHDDGVMPMVIVENHVTDFPIITAVKNWNAVGTKFRFGTCNDFDPCVKVYTVHQGANGYDATTAIQTWEGPPRTIVNPVIIRLNHYYGYYGPWPGYSARLQTTMHELGHAVGLVHDTSGGVMASGVDGKHTTISSYEVRELRSLYGL